MTFMGFPEEFNLDIANQIIELLTTPLYNLSSAELNGVKLKKLKAITKYLNMPNSIVLIEWGCNLKTKDILIELTHLFIRYRLFDHKYILDTWWLKK